MSSLGDVWARAGVAGAQLIVCLLWALGSRRSPRLDWGLICEEPDKAQERLKALVRDWWCGVVSGGSSEGRHGACGKEDQLDSGAQEQWRGWASAQTNAGAGCVHVGRE